MITYAEFIALVAFIGLGGYVIYLQHQLNEARDACNMMSRALNDIASGNVDVRRTETGIEVRVKRQTGGGTHGDS
jgi:hypothetical protein